MMTPMLRFLIVTGLLLTAPCFAASPVNPAPIFDHDPMSIAVGDVVEAQSYQKPADPAAGSAKRVPAQKLTPTPIPPPAVTHVDPFNKIQAGHQVTITVYASMDASAAPIKLQVLRTFDAATKTLQATNTDPAKPDYDIVTDTVTTSQDPKAFVQAQFQVTFHIWDGKPHKFYLVATKNPDDGQSTVQTINVYP